MDFNLRKKLKDDENDISFPVEVFNDFANELNTEIDPYAKVLVKEYKGAISSYTSSALTDAIKSITISTNYNVQDDLGMIGDSNFNKYECTIISHHLPDFCFRLFLSGYSIGGYPCKIVLEEGFAEEVNKSLGLEGYTYIVKDKQELTDLLMLIFKSEKFFTLIKQIYKAAKRANNLLQ